MDERLRNLSTNPYPPVIKRFPRCIISSSQILVERVPKASEKPKD